MTEVAQAAKKKTAARVPKLEGRIIERAIIHYANPDSTQPEYTGPSFELRLSGGFAFTFTAMSKPVSTQAEVVLFRDTKGDCDDLVRATITEEGIVDYAD